VRADWGIPGLAVGIVKGDSLVYARGFGVREAGRADAVDPHTIFAIGSNTKSFTAIAAAMLVDEGRLRWDDRAEDRYPGFRLHDPYVSRDIRIRDLLSHRSGLGRRGDALWYGTDFSREDILRRIRFLEPNAPFRTEMGYQNVMYLAAGEIVGRVSGLGWDRFIHDRLFAPLGMRRSSTSVKALAGQANVATPHALDGTAARTIPWRDIDNIAPAGSTRWTSSARSKSEADVSSPGTTPFWCRWRPRTRVQTTTGPGRIATRPPRFASSYVSVPCRASTTFAWPRIRLGHSLAIESSRSSMTPGAPELSILTTSSASSAGPVIWFR
jgi:CubicO group peptidase (beta-lactamase class C family)